MVFAYFAVSPKVPHTKTTPGGGRTAVLAMGFPDLDHARAVPIPREWAGYTKSYNPTGLLGNSWDTQLRAKPPCTQTGD